MECFFGFETNRIRAICVLLQSRSVAESFPVAHEIMPRMGSRGHMFVWKNIQGGSRIYQSYV